MNLKEATQKVAGTWGKDLVQFFTCTVDSVNVKKRLCMVTPVNGDFASFPAYLMTEVQDGVLIIPSEGSTVKVLFSDRNSPTVIQYSHIDEVRIISGDQTFVIKDGLTQINDGKYGGLAVVKDPDNPDAGLLARLNKIEDDNNKLKTDISNILTPANTLLAGLAAISTSTAPVVGSALFTLFNPFITAIVSNLTPYSSQPLVKTTEAMISNPNVKHGKIDTP